MEKLDQYSYIWTGEKDNWQIKDLGDNDFLIFNLSESSALTIDDDELYQALVSKMIEEGIEVCKI
ncbi:hypothetical protein A9Q81_07700 [Gammaproteobacteria bacterium 42_54_T18]|nr:hypothetical protein A9Q81_07700 [Gammaproteobacteria bacterium 42_54_T18]